MFSSHQLFSKLVNANQSVIENFETLLAPGVTNEELFLESLKYIEQLSKEHQNELPGLSTSFPPCIGFENVFAHGHPVPGQPHYYTENSFATIDCGLTARINGNQVITDNAQTYFIGQPSQKEVDFLNLGPQSYQSALEIISETNGEECIDKVASAISSVIEGGNASVLKNIFGHSIDTNLHGGYLVPNHPVNVEVAQGVSGGNSFAKNLFYSIEPIYTDIKLSDGVPIDWLQGRPVGIEVSNYIEEIDESNPFYSFIQDYRSQGKGDHISFMELIQHGFTMEQIQSELAHVFHPQSRSLNREYVSVVGGNFAHFERNFYIGNNETTDYFY